MVTTIGIVSEGVTDQIVIENILRGYLGDREDDAQINYVQPPPLDETGQQGERVGGSSFSSCGCVATKRRSSGTITS